MQSGSSSIWEHLVKHPMMICQGVRKEINFLQLADVKKSIVHNRQCNRQAFRLPNSINPEGRYYFIFSQPDFFLNHYIQSSLSSIEINIYVCFFIDRNQYSQFFPHILGQNMLCTREGGYHVDASPQFHDLHKVFSILNLVISWYKSDYYYFLYRLL